MKIKLLILSASAILTGCSTTSSTSAPIQNWKNYGFEQALKGNIIQIQAPETQGDYQRYQNGYETGKKVYCSRDPYRLGMLGKDYQGICDDVVEDFQTQYNLGRLEYFSIQAEMASDDNNRADFE